MIMTLIHIESRYPANREKIRSFVVSYLEKKFSRDVEVSVSIVGDRKMKRLNSEYRKKDSTTDVLSFPVHDPAASSHRDVEVGFSPQQSSPDEVIRLGDVVVSYPQVLLEASETNTLVDTVIEKLIAHGLDHLMGIHHPE